MPERPAEPTGVTGISAGATGSGTSGEPAIELEGIWVRFGGLQALQEVSFSAARGEVSGLIGPNGAGKTTLFNVATGLQRPERGRVRLLGREVTRMGAHRRCRLGVARTFQRLELFWSLTVEENIRVAAEAHLHRRLRGVGAGLLRGNASPWNGPSDGGLRRHPRSQTTASTVARILDRTGLTGLATERVDGLPTGTARLVELARALATDPVVLLADEPGSGLDDADASTLGSLLRELASDGMAVVLVEHDMGLVMRTCHRVTVLDFGTVIASGKPSDVRSDPAVQAAYLGAPGVEVPAR